MKLAKKENRKSSKKELIEMMERFSNREFRTGNPLGLSDWDLMINWVDRML